MKERIATVGLRLFGVYLLVLAIMQVGQLASSFAEQDDWPPEMQREFLTSTTTHAALSVLASWLLLWEAARIARLLFRGDAMGITCGNVPHFFQFSTALVLFGLYWLLMAVTLPVELVFFLDYEWSSVLAMTTVTVVHVGLGLFFILGAPKIEAYFDAVDAIKLAEGRNT